MGLPSLRAIIVVRLRRCASGHGHRVSLPLLSAHAARLSSSLSLSLLPLLGISRRPGLLYMLPPLPPRAPICYAGAMRCYAVLSRNAMVMLWYVLCYAKLYYDGSIHAAFLHYTSHSPLHAGCDRPCRGLTRFRPARPRCSLPAAYATCSAGDGPTAAQVALAAQVQSHSCWRTTLCRKTLHYPR